MFLLLVLLFGSVTQPFIVLSAIPFAIAAVVVALALHGQPLSLFAGIGTLGLAGVVVNDALILIDAINCLCKERSNASLKDLVVEATVGRLRPIVLTTITTVAGMLPLVYGIGGTDVYMGPMALALGYGLLFSLPITLIILPCLYLLGADIGRVFRFKSMSEFKNNTLISSRS